MTIQLCFRLLNEIRSTGVRTVPKVRPESCALMEQELLPQWSLPSNRK
jgi:hypothetical protein